MVITRSQTNTKHLQTFETMSDNDKMIGRDLFRYRLFKARFQELFHQQRAIGPWPLLRANFCRTVVPTTETLMKIYQYIFFPSVPVSFV